MAEELVAALRLTADNKGIAEEAHVSKREPQRLTGVTDRAEARAGIDPAAPGQPHLASETFAADVKPIACGALASHALVAQCHSELTSARTTTAGGWDDEDRDDDVHGDDWWGRLADATGTVIGFAIVFGSLWWWLDVASRLPGLLAFLAAAALVGLLALVRPAIGVCGLIAAMISRR